MRRIKLTLLLAALTSQQMLAQMPETLPKKGDQSVAKKKKPLNALTADITTGWIVTEVTTPEDSYKWRNGTGFEFSYRKLFERGYGISFDFAHSGTGYPSRYYGGEYKLKANYYGISLLYGGFVGRQFIATVGVGVGCAYTYGSDKGEVGFGMKNALNVEYQLSPHIGIGAGLDYFLCISSNQQNNEFFGKKYDVSGFKRLALHAGLRVYF